MSSIVLVRPRVLITPEAMTKLQLYTDVCLYEISGLGEAVKIGNAFLITSVMIFKQGVTSGSTELDPSTVHSFLLELVNRGLDPEGFKLWWHSHAYGGVFWSKTDDDTANAFQNGWMLSIVANKNKKTRVRLDVYDPCRITIDDIPLEVYLPADGNLRNEIEDEVKEKVKKVKRSKQQYPLIVQSVAASERGEDDDNDEG